MDLLHAVQHHRFVQLRIIFPCAFVDFLQRLSAVELFWNTLAAVIMFFCLYYPIGLYRNAYETDSVHERGALFFLFVWVFMLFTST